MDSISDLSRSSESLSAIERARSHVVGRNCYTSYDYGRRLRNATFDVPGINTAQ